MIDSDLGFFTDRYGRTRTLEVWTLIVSSLSIFYVFIYLSIYLFIYLFINTNLFATIRFSKLEPELFHLLLDPPVFNW